MAWTYGSEVEVHRGLRWCGVARADLGLGLTEPDILLHVLPDAREQSGLAQHDPKRSMPHCHIGVRGQPLLTGLAGEKLATSVHVVHVLGVE